MPDEDTVVVLSRFAQFASITRSPVVAAKWQMRGKGYGTAVLTIGEHDEIILSGEDIWRLRQKGE